MSSGQMSTTQHEQEFAPEQNNSSSHSAQDSGDSDSDTVRERAPEWDMAFSFQVAEMLSRTAAPCWFTDYMSVSESKLDSKLQILNKNIQAVDIRLQNSVQAADHRFTALQQQIESVQQKVDDNANAILSVQQKVDDNVNAILSVTTGFSKFSDTLTTVQCKLDALQNRCDQRMSIPATVGSDNTDMKRHSQSNQSVDTISTYSQQSSVCSAVVIEPLGYQPSTPLPTALPASYNMHVPPPANVSVAHSTSQGMAPVHSYQNQTSGTQDSMSQNLVNSSSANQSSVIQNCGNQGSVTPGSGSSGSGNPGSVGQCSSNLGSDNQGSGTQVSVNRSAACQGQDTTDYSTGNDRMTLEKPRNISIRFPVYDVGDSFHTFIAAFEAVLQRYGMMDETALCLPECFSPSAFSLSIFASKSPV